MRLRHYILILCSAVASACNSSPYDIAESRPTLEIQLLQDSYTANEPIYLQLRASQRGYDGLFQLSIVLSAGECECAFGGKSVPMSGEWVELSSTSEILTIMPHQTGMLRISFEVKTDNGSASARSFINLNVRTSSILHLDFSYPEAVAYGRPVEIIFTVRNEGTSGMIPIQTEQIKGEGKLQFGSMVVESATIFSVPVNSPQVLYYTASSYGIHRLQFSVIDAYNTYFQNIEFIITR